MTRTLTHEWIKYSVRLHGSAHVTRQFVSLFKWKTSAEKNQIKFLEAEFNCVGLWRMSNVMRNRSTRASANQEAPSHSENPFCHFASRTPLTRCGAASGIGAMTRRHFNANDAKRRIRPPRIWRWSRRQRRLIYVMQPSGTEFNTTIDEKSARTQWRTQTEAIPSCLVVARTHAHQYVQWMRAW